MDEKDNAQKPANSAPADAQPPVPPHGDPPPVAQDTAPEREDRRHEMSTSDWIMSIATVVIALGTIVSAAAIFLQWREMANGATDTTAIKNAAQKQADAAQKFADTAVLINSEIGNAVDKLKNQNAAMNRLAHDTEAANANSLAADRPWIGATLSFDAPIALGKSPTAIIQFINSGKRPARILSTGAEPKFFKVFPADPPYRDSSGGKSSGGFIVPGASNFMRLKLTTNGPIDQAMMDKLLGDESFYIYARIDYVDMGTNVVHHTHACWKYTVDPIHASPDGFYNCSMAEGYEDAN